MKKAPPQKPAGKPDHEQDLNHEEELPQIETSAKIIPFPKSAPAWMGCESEFWFEDDEPDAPRMSIPLDYNSRDDRNSEMALDRPGSFSRTAFNDLVDAFEDADACKKLFYLSKMDKDLEEALLASIQHFTEGSKEPAETMCGLFVGGLLAFMTNHPAFRRNFGGPTRIPKKATS